MLKNLKRKIRSKIEKKYWYKEKNEDMFLSVHERPMKAKGDLIAPKNDIAYLKVGIVIQGIWVAKDDFTLETIRLYKAHYPGTEIIVSIWDDISKEQLELLRKEKVHVVLNETPVNVKGCGTLNYQLINTLAGIKKAKGLGCRYVCKTRTDQRMYATGLFEGLVALQEAFPIDHSKVSAKKRIVGTSFNTIRNRCYALTDLWMFGDIDDMFTYWSVEQDQRNRDDYRWVEEQQLWHTDVIEYSKCRFCEIYLCSSYLEHIGCKLQWTHEDSDKLLAENFVLIDKESIDLLWPKYGDKEYRWLKYDSDEFQQYRFIDWISNQSKE